MTLAEEITLVLDRVGLDSTSTTFKDQARRYLNLTAIEVSNLVKWWWLDRTTTFKTTQTFTITGASGTFTVGETVTGGTSASTAIVDSHDTTNALLYVYTISADFTASETITGGTSSVTATYSSAAKTRVYTPVSGNVGSWYSFVDETNSNVLDVIGPDEYDVLDEDRTETGTVEAVFVGGVDTTTGYPTIELWRTPSTTAEVMRVRYQVAVASWSSSNDASEMIVLGLPQIAESAVLYGATKLYLEEKGDDSGAQREGRELAKAVALLKKQNRRMQGNRRYPARESQPDFIIQTNTVLAVGA